MAKKKGKGKGRSLRLTGGSGQIPDGATLKSPNNWNRHQEASMGWTSFIEYALENNIDILDQSLGVNFTSQVVSDEELITFAADPLVQRAVGVIKWGVARMKWAINPPEDADREDEAVHKVTKRLTTSLRKPNKERKNNTYTTLVASTVNDLLLWGESYWEKQPPLAIAKDEERDFWLWNIDYTGVEPNRQWDASMAGVHPIIWYNKTKEKKEKDWVPLLSKDVVSFDMDTTTYNNVPSSPLKTAYIILQKWRKVFSQNSQIVETTGSSKLVSVEGATQPDVQAMQMAIDSRKGDPRRSLTVIGGKASPVSLTSRSDAELYPGYVEFLVTLIGLCFNLSRRAMGLTDHDNRATSGEAADSDFQDGILPIAVFIEGVINDQIISEYEPGYRFELVDTEPRSESEESTRARELFQATIISRNEARVLSSMEPVKGEDTLVDGRKLGEVAEEEGQMGQADQGGGFSPGAEEPEDFYDFWGS